MDKHTEAHLITIYELIETLAKTIGVAVVSAEAQGAREMAHTMASNLGGEDIPRPDPIRYENCPRDDHDPDDMSDIGDTIERIREEGA